MNLKHWVFRCLTVVLIILFLALPAMAGGVLKKGESAPEDCRWFSEKEAQEILLALKERNNLRQQQILTDQILTALEQHIELLEQSNRLLFERNEALIKAEQKRKKWQAVKNVTNVVLAVGLAAVAAYASK